MVVILGSFIGIFTDMMYRYCIWMFHNPKKAALLLVSCMLLDHLDVGRHWDIPSYHNADQTTIQTSGSWLFPMKLQSCRGDDALMTCQYGDDNVLTVTYVDDRAKTLALAVFNDEKYAPTDAAAHRYLRLLGIPYRDPTTANMNEMSWTNLPGFSSVRITSNEFMRVNSTTIQSD